MDLRRDDSRVIIHFDYDCFYASVFEAENPVLKSLPLAVQQKQIVVTCNYEARRRGLRKLQLVKEAKKICPDVVIVLGEDLTKFRDASKALYSFLRSFLWGSRIEKLGFDEVFLDVTDMIDYNVGLLNQHDLVNSFFYLDKRDPTQGFAFDATQFCGPTYPASSDDTTDAANSLPQAPSDALSVRLILGSHLANYLRTRLEEERGYTATVGVSTSKLLAKLVGNVNKPNNQTTLIPPYVAGDGHLESNVTRFLDSHEVGKVPGIGFRLSHKLRTYILGREPSFVPYTVQSHEDRVTVRDVRLSPGMGPALLQKILGGPGAPKDVGFRVWALLNGVDSSEVQEARTVPTQISIEDSYRGLDHFDAVKKELQSLAVSLIRRMRIDLTEEDPEGDVPDDPQKAGKLRWLAHPRTLRLSTRRRAPSNPDGSRSHSSNRVSRSGPAPSFIFNLEDSVEAVANRLVEESLLSMFRKLHPEKSFGELNLINIAVTNMVESAGEQKQSSGRDIAKMLRQQESVLKEWRVSERSPSSMPLVGAQPQEVTTGLDKPSSAPPRKQEMKDSSVVDIQDATWEESDDEELLSNDRCDVCGAFIPHFALAAHAQYHEAPD
ncbi:hypothetical protein VTN77DRAFT_8935 [Rasamsonia byssochlamydoides]|uniref:uncharacterized protein n=1 Tax=Rasamsonia byssochlamydoides TaxID=89139 RepID=UPI00374259C6